MDMILWNAFLTFFILPIAWYLKEQNDEIKRLQILVNKTREEYVSRVDHAQETDRILEYLRRLEDKIDRLSERR